MLEVVLIRPGATDFDAEGRIQGTLDIPLSVAGRTEVEQLIRDLQDRGLEAIYASDCQPAQATAQALAKALALRVKKLDEMHNVDHGLWQGMRVEEVRRKQPKVYRQWQETPELICPPEGEMLADARCRVQRAVEKLRRKHASGTIGLVVPEPLASVVRQALVDCELGDLWHAATEHGRFEILSLGNGVPARLPS